MPVLGVSVRVMAANRVSFKVLSPLVFISFSSPQPMTRPFTLAHFSDVHLPFAAGFAPRYWNVKRTLGFLNWHRKRKALHQREVADRLVADIKAIRADHVVITGDLINLGLPAEYEAALGWLGTVGPPEGVTVVPGNHDIYTRLKGHPGVTRWAAYMGSEEQSLAFPFVRRAGPLALIGVNSAVETKPFFASGKVGAAQIDVLSSLLLGLKNEGAIRVVIIHHPPLPGLASARRGLEDAAQLAQVLKRCGAELVLYGHDHCERLNWHGLCERAGGFAVPVLCVPSASAAKPYRDAPLARYNIFTFFSSLQGVRIRYGVRGIASPEGPVVKLSETMLEYPP